MKQFYLYRRGKNYYSQDSKTGKRQSLKTSDKAEAKKLLLHKEESRRQPFLNLQIAKTYLSGLDPEMGKRTWQTVMERLEKQGGENTRKRARWATQCKVFDKIRQKCLLETTAEEFLRVLEEGGQSVNHFLRRYHNLALGLGWLPWPILPKKLWPPIRHGAKRAIKAEEHARIVAREGNKERRLFYELLWETGASQSDAASLTNENIDWNQRILTIHRKKIERLDPIPAQIKIGEKLERVLRELPANGPLFPVLKEIHSRHRASDFHRRCAWLKIYGVSLHSYRYSWAERAAAAGMHERFAQANLGHGSKVIHRAYARRAQILTPSLEECEARRNVVIPVNFEQKQIA